MNEDNSTTNLGSLHIGHFIHNPTFAQGGHFHDMVFTSIFVNEVRICQGSHFIRTILVEADDIDPYPFTQRRVTRIVQIQNQSIPGRDPLV